MLRLSPWNDIVLPDWIPGVNNLDFGQGPGAVFGVGRHRSSLSWFEDSCLLPQFEFHFSLEDKSDLLMGMLVGRDFCLRLELEISQHQILQKYRADCGSLFNFFFRQFLNVEKAHLSHLQSKFEIYYQINEMKNIKKSLSQILKIFELKRVNLINYKRFLC